MICVEFSQVIQLGARRNVDLADHILTLSTAKVLVGAAKIKFPGRCIQNRINLNSINFSYNNGS